jgi:hypothetical protein
VSPSSLTFGTLGIPAQDVTLTTGAGCPWTATRSASWINIDPDSSGTGSATLRIRLDVYVDVPGNSRTGSVTVGGQTINITQTFP